MVKKQQIIKEILTDPGIGFSASAIFLYAAATDMIGLLACLAAFAFSLTIKIMLVTKTGPKKESLLFDPRLTLWVISLALLVVAINALTHTEFLAALSSCFLAAANVRMAESMTRKDPNKSILHLLFSRADLYIIAGTICACLLAGKEAGYLIPILLISLALSLHNVWHQKPEYYRHPKLLVAFSSMVSVIIGLFNGNFLVALAHSLIAMVYISFESRITPGGLKQIFKDLK